MFYKNSHHILSEKEYYNFVLNKYQPTAYESGELTDPRFKKSVWYSHVCKTRSFLIYQAIASHLRKGSHVVDFGFFPGTIIRQLKILFKEDIVLYGVGQKVDEEFRQALGQDVKECVLAEFDPFYRDSNIGIPLESNSFDAVIATEILEHLISPLEMLSEGARILKKGGLFIITTPNVSHIGAIAKLLSGKSNYERLDHSPMYVQNNTWRGHIRFYDKGELVELFKRNGLKLLRHEYYLERGWMDHAKWPFIKRLVIECVDKLIPCYRESHFAVFIKE